jgi:hypothetical protein
MCKTEEEAVELVTFGMLEDVEGRAGRIQRNILTLVNGSEAVWFGEHVNLILLIMLKSS